MAEIHRLDLRVYYEDTDASGIVYHANYLRFMERGRTEWLRQLGLGHAEMMGQAEFQAFAVRRMAIEFERPARIDDLLTIETEISQTSGARLTLFQRVLKDGALLIQAEVEIVCLNDKGRPLRLPMALQTALAGRRN